MTPDDSSPPAHSIEAKGGGLPRRLGKNVLVYYVAFAVGAVVGFITTPVLVRHLGITAYGVWVLVGSVVVYLELLELGFGAATTKLMAENASRDDVAAVRTLNTNVFVLTLFGFVAILVGFALSSPALEWLGIPKALQGQAHVAVLIMTVAVSVSIPFDAFGGALAAYQRVDLLSTSNLVRGVAAGIGGAIAALLGGGIVGVTIVTAVAGMSVHYLRWRLLKGLLPGLRLSPRLIERPRLRETLQLSGWFMLRDITSVVITRLDLVVVGVMLDLRAVAIYSVALKLSQMTMRALQPFTELFFPRASALSTAQDRAGLAGLLVDGTRISLVVATPLVLILALLARPALIAWVGPDFRDAVSVLVVLAVTRGLAALTETAWWLLGGAGYIKWTSTLSIVEAVVNLGSSVALAPVLGPAGVAAGSLLGVVFARLPVALTVSGRLTGLTTKFIARRALLPHAIPAALTTTVLLVAAPVLPAEPLPVVAAAGCAFVLYLATYLTLGATPPEKAKARAVLSLRRRTKQDVVRPLGQVYGAD